MSCDNNPDHQHFWSHQCANLVSLLSANAAQASNIDVMGSVFKPLLRAPPPKCALGPTQNEAKNPMMKGAQLWLHMGHVVPTFLWLFICLWFKVYNGVCRKFKPPPPDTQGTQNIN